MTYSKKQIIDASLRTATMAGGDPNQSVVIDNSVVIEDLFYEALRQSVVLGAQNPSEAGSLKRDHTIAVSNGVGALPDTVLEECLNDSSVYSDSDSAIGEFASFQPHYNDYLRTNHSQLPYYAVQASSFLFRDAGGDANDYDGDIHLVTVSLPDIPAVVTDAMTINPQTAERTIQILASMLRGAPAQ